MAIRTMTCRRCEGLMIVETAYDKDLAICGEQQEVRCVNCGNIEDTMIWINRGRVEVKEGRRRASDPG
jgi:hypothetical protein